MKRLGIVVWLCVGVGCGSNESVPLDVAADVADDTANDAVGDAVVPMPDGAGDTAESPSDIAAAPDTVLDTAPDTVPDVAPDIAPDIASPPDIFDPTPPCAAITVAEGLAIAPPMVVTLSGLASTGDVARWQWSIVSRPAHAFTGLATPTAANTSIDIAVAGEWRFRLETWDSKNRAACDPAEVTIVATPTAPIHIELWWNDNTANPAAEIGADLDLHVFHPDAVGIDVDGNGTFDRWFDPLYDVAWHNPDASWPGPADDPENGPKVRLLRRDDAGYGPEVIAIDNPRAGDVYTVAFHVWDDTNTQYLQPTEVRVYIDGVLRQRPNYAVPLRASKLERVMTIAWPWLGQQSFSFLFQTDGDMRPTSPTK